MTCKTKRCGRHVYKTEKSSYCSRCRNRRYREKHPIQYAFTNLRNRAKRRGIPFSLTFAEFERLALKTDYHRLKGRSSLSLSIDRKENALGYHAWNIQVITIRENSRKQHVPYFGGPMLSREDRQEQERLDREIMEDMENMARTLVKVGTRAGCPGFWELMSKYKDWRVEQ